MNNSATSPAFSDLAIILRDLKVGVGAWWALGFLSQALATLLYRHLCTVTVRITRLIARFEAGLLPARARAGRVLVGRPAEAVAEVPVPPVVRIWPNQFAWLVRRAAWRAACYGGQLETVLARPEMIALLAASPQAVRVLAPLCRMLGIAAHTWRPGVVAKPVAAPKMKRIREPRVAIVFKIPLPRGVLTMARRRDFKLG